MNFFIVNQNFDSTYNDEEGKRYEYPTSIANGKQIKINDYLIFNLSKKEAKKLGNPDKRLIGIAQIDSIERNMQNKKEYATASYNWYLKFNNYLTFDDIGGDPRNNQNNAMSKIDSSNISNILIGILKSLG